MGAIACVVAKVIGVEHGINGMSCTFVNGSEYSANTCDLTAIVFDRFDSRLSGKACGNRCGKHEYVFAFDHRGNIVAEDKLASGCVLGSYHVDGLMRVEVHKITFSQLFGKAGTYDLSSVETENGINYSCVVIVGNQFLGNSLSLGKTGLLRRYVNIVIDV